MAWKFLMVAASAGLLAACASQGDSAGDSGSGEAPMMAEAEPAAAARGPQEIRGEAINTMLSGNTASGLWRGQPFTQYFNPNGATDFAINGQVVDVGRWWVREDGIYCSWWEATGNVCYGLKQQDATTLIWVPMDDMAPFPSTVSPGNNL